MNNQSACLQLAELEHLVQAVEPAAVLLSPRLLRRVIKQDRAVAGIGLQVPHRKSYVAARANLLQIVSLQDMGRAPDSELPANVVLLARPSPRSLARTPRTALLLKYWRILFHARVHLALEQRLPPGAAIRQRLQDIGQTEFEEIRSVLWHDEYLLPQRDEREVYIEFAAVYLELRFFAAPLLPRYFPGLGRLDRIDELLAGDIAAERLFAATRLDGAPLPAVPEDRTEEDTEQEPATKEETAASTGTSLRAYRVLIRRAKKALRHGNVVRAAIARTQAASVAPPERQAETRESARADLGRLAERLQATLALDRRDSDRWRSALTSILDPAARGVWPVEARLLYDLQKVCIDSERELFVIDLVEWILSLGRRPLKRPLPCQREVLFLKHLRSAARRARAACIAEHQRQRLVSLLQAAIQQQEEHVRAHFRPLVAAALNQVGMQPQNLPERVALNKVVEELLDRITEHGFLTMGSLRDALSSNNLKLPDLGGDFQTRVEDRKSRSGHALSSSRAFRWSRFLGWLSDFFLGDPLIQANRRLAVVLDGVYRRGEIYLRWLQRLSSLAFGTRLGRFLTRYAALPFGGAFVVLVGVQEIINVGLEFTIGGKIHLMMPVTIGGTGAGSTWHVRFPLAVLLLGSFFFGLLHVEGFRGQVVRALGALGRAAHGLFLDFPAFLARLPIVRKVLESRPFVIFRRVIFKPLLIAMSAGAILWVCGIRGETALLASLFIFLTAGLLLNTRLGRDLEEAAIEWAVRTWQHLHFNLLPGLFRLVLAFFKRLVEAVDRFLYRVDEWLRFRSGDSRLALIVKPFCGLLWFFVTYVVRIYVNLFIEPTINPVKHFPVVTVAAKLMLPLYPTLAQIIAATIPLERALAYSIAYLNVPLISGIFGFLVWELKENWRLYESNRPHELQPVVIGHHGETMLRLLKPGFHSGTVPKLFAKLRRAERAAFRTGDWKAAHRHAASLHHVEQEIRQFIDREFVFLLQQSKRSGLATLATGSIHLATNRIGIELSAPAFGSVRLGLIFEEHAGWLLAGIADQGWLASLSPAQERAFAAALAGLYKMAGAGLVREHIEACLGPAYRFCAITDQGLVVRYGLAAEAVYNLGDSRAIMARPLEGNASALWPSLRVTSLLFKNVPITWQQWLETWVQDLPNPAASKTLLDSVILLPRSQPATPVSTGRSIS